MFRCTIFRISTLTPTLVLRYFSRVFSSPNTGICNHSYLAPHLLDLGGTLNDAVLLIGDKVFEYRARYAYSYDLAHAWRVWTQLPMVFAVWASTSPLESSFLALFNEAMEFGFSDIPEALNDYPLPSFITKTNATDYLTRRINYHFDAAKHQALELYLQKVKRLPDLAPQFVSFPTTIWRI